MRRAFKISSIPDEFDELFELELLDEFDELLELELLEEFDELLELELLDEFEELFELELLDEFEELFELELLATFKRPSTDSSILFCCVPNVVGKAACAHPAPMTTAAASVAICRLFLVICFSCGVLPEPAVTM